MNPHRMAGRRIRFEVIKTKFITIGLADFAGLFCYHREILRKKEDTESEALNYKS
jgi:hypothetical protein